MTLSDFSVEGLVAIVTGASRGIGKGIAMVLAEAGVDVCLAARSGDALEEVAKEIRALGRRCIAIPTDVTNGEAVDRMVQTAILELGHVDILVNNAGVAVVKPIVPLPGFKPATSNLLPNFYERYSEEEWEQVINTNLKGAFLCMRSVGPHMIERRKGKIVNITSVNAVKSGKFRFTYDISKAGLSQLTRSSALEWIRYDINVNAIGAAYVDTELTAIQMQDERLRNKLLAEIPMRRLAKEREVALLAVYLSSPASDFMTGQTVFLDGGILA